MQPLLLSFRPRIYRQAACKLARAERYWAAHTATRAIIHPMAGAGEHHPEPGTPLRMIDIVRSGQVACSTRLLDIQAALQKHCAWLNGHQAQY